MKAKFESIKPKIIDKKVYVKIHESDMASIFAFSDPELIDKTLQSDKISLFVNPTFYKGKLIPLIDALKIISEHPNANIVGRLAYYAALLKIIDPRILLWIHDKNTNWKIPHVILMRT